jgi:hypothetical protein
MNQTKTLVKKTNNKIACKDLSAANSKNILFIFEIYILKGIVEENLPEK